MGAYLINRSDRRAVDSLEYATRRYPDDSELWSWLAEAHVHGLSCEGPHGAEAAFRRATDLNPDVGPYWLHPVQLAIGLHRDRALAERRMRAAGRAELAQGIWFEGRDPSRHPGIRLVFGPGSAAVRAQEYLDEIERVDWELGGSPAAVYTGHPSLWGLRDTLLRTHLEREGRVRGTVLQLLLHDLKGGRLDRWREDAERFDPDGWQGLYSLAIARSYGVPVPDSLLRRRLERVSGTEAMGPSYVLARAMAAADLGETDVERRIDRTLTTWQEEGEWDSFQAAAVEKAVEGYRRWRAGEEDEALELLLAVPAQMIPGLWIGDLHRGAGRLEEAARCYEADWTQPVAYMRLGEVYTEMGRDEEALTAYRTFLDLWEAADPQLQAFVEPARQGVERR